MKNTLSQYLLFLIIPFLMVLAACSGRKTQEKISDITDNQIAFKSSFDFLSNLTLLEPPLIIDSSFDSFQEPQYLSQSQIDLLNLKVIDEGSGTRFYLGSKINLSESFQTFLVHFLPNEHELFSVLVNYDSDFKILDFQVVAYDDIAEGFSRIYSNVNQSVLEVTEISFINEEPETILREVSVAQDGKFLTK